MVDTICVVPKHALAPRSSDGPGNVRRALLDRKATFIATSAAPSTRQMVAETSLRSRVKAFTYEVTRVPTLGDRFGWRAIARAAREIGEWMMPVPVRASARPTPVWLLSTA